MTNSKNSNLEDVSKGNDESAPGANDSTSNKKTRFNKSKSISDVFKELEFEDDESYENSKDFEDDNSYELSDFEDDESYDLSDEYEVDYEDDYDDDEVDEIIPIHNEYGDLEKSDALYDESIEGGVIINPDLDDSTEANVSESDEGADLIENDDSIDDEEDIEFSESLDSDDSIDDEDSFIAVKDSDIVLADDAEENIGKSSAQGVLINDKKKSSDSSERSLDIFDSSTIFTLVGFVVGLAILILGISYYFSSSDRVVDNVLSGETAGLAIFLVIIGLIIIGFSLLKFFSSSKSSLIIDTFNSIKSIDYDDVSEEGITRDDFDAIFGILKRKKDSNFSTKGDDDKAVDSSKDLFEKDDEEKVSDEDINSLYSDSNLTSQKNQSSFNEHENANSTENSQDDDEIDEIIPIHSKLNKQSDESNLEDKYSKYDFEETYDDEFDLVEEEAPQSLEEDESLAEEELVEEEEFEEIVEEDSFDEAIEEDLVEEDSYSDAIEEDSFDEVIVEDDAGSDLEAEKDDGLEDKYSKYDFDDSDDDMEESVEPKPKFKKSVDLSKFENEDLTEEELAEKERRIRELEEKKRRIIEGTNFDNSLRKE